MMKNHFATLGLKLGAGEEDVKKAYRSLAKQWHPDKNCNPGAEEKFKEIGAAYKYLQSKDRRELLARELSQKAKPSTKPPTQTTAQSKSSGTHTSSAGQPSSSKPSYNWNYKGTEKTSPPPPTSSQSSTRTGPSKENQSPGSQGKKTKAPHWSDSFHKKNRGGKSRQEAAGSHSRADWKPWGNDWQDDAEDIPSAPHFSDAFSSFRTFVDQLGGHFGAAFFFGTDDTDFGLFGEPGSFRGGRGARPAQGRGKPRQAPRNVASEHGYTGGLDDDLLFEPGAGKQESAKTAKCPICKKMVTPAGLARHEQYCGRFDAPSDTDEDEVPPFRGKVYSSDDDDYYHDDAEDYFMGPFGKPKDGDWRSTHEDVLNKIRRDRKMYAANLKRQATEEVGCKWCGRTFNPMALQRHLPVCKEHVLRYGRPMNPTAARGPPPESKFARSRKYSESVPKPHAGGASQKFPGREADEGEDRYSTSSSSSPSSPPPTMGARFSYQPGNMRPNARPSPPKDAPHRSPAADTSKNTSPTNGAGRGKPPAASSSGTKQPSKSNSSAGGQSGGQGKKFQGTGFKVGGANTHASRQTNGRGTKR